jgi:hypothetical protein
VRPLELSGSGAALSIRIGEASGSECSEPWGNTAIELPRRDFAADLADLYLTSDEAGAQISLTFTATQLQKQLVRRLACC